jgi:hypothetical protein
MYQGSAVLVASAEDSGRIGLIVGSWEEVVKMDPGGFRSYSSRSSRFRMLMDSRTLEYLPGVETAAIGDRIWRYRAKISIPPAGESLFRSSGKYVYAYYNRDERKLVLTSF